MAGDHDAAAGVPVEPVHQLQVALFRVEHPQRLDQPQADPAAAVHRQPGGLIKDEDLIVLVEQRPRQPLGQPAADHRRRLGLAGAHRRHAHHVVHGQAGGLLGALLVHPHLAGSDNPIDTRTGHTLEVGDQEIIKALAVTAFIDGNESDAIGGGGI